MFVKRLIAISIALFFSACSVAQNSTMPTIQPVMPSLVLSSTPTVVPSTSTPLIQMNINKTCWDVKSLADSNIQLEGGVLYHDPVIKEWLVLDLGSLETIQWDYDYPWAISPDGKTIARYLNGSNILHLISQNQIMDFQTPKPVTEVAFLSDNKILLQVSGKETQIEPGGSGLFTDNFYILSTLTGNITEKSVRLPDYYHMTGIYAWSVKYSPDFRYVIYPTSSGSALANIDEQKVYWNSGQSWSDPFALPIWKPDSSSITFVQLDGDEGHSENFYEVSIDGQLSKLTELQQVLPSYDSLGWRAWSPNGRYLWFTADTPQTPSLPSGKANSIFLFDSDARTLLDPCVSVRYGIGDPHVWSPNSDYLALVSSDLTQIIILDINNQTIYQAYKQPGVDFVDPWAKPNQSVLQLEGWLSWELP